MLRALRIDLSDGERSRPSQHKRETKQDSKKKGKVGEAGYTMSQSPIYVDCHHTHSSVTRIVTARLVPDGFLGDHFKTGQRK